MKSNHIMVKQKLGFFDILKQPLNLTYKNTHFILLIFLSSLPLFCFLLYYELLLQKTLVRISEFVRHQHPDSFGGSERRRCQGLVISLVFSVFGLALRGSCWFFACCGRRNGVVAHAGVFCILNVMKWVVFVVYFNNCKRQSLWRKGGGKAFGDNGWNAKTAYEVCVPPDDGLDVRTC
ncbi:unnamed protein product [Malus baccata var. baccata]